MVFLSEASIREMVQEALGGGGYPTLDGDGNFPIVPSPLAEPIVTKLALQPVRVMRVPTDRHEFELAVRELADGVEQDHLPTLFLKLRELVKDFTPPTTQETPCPDDCSTKDDQMANVPSDHDEEMIALRAEVRKYIKAIMEESDSDDDTAEKIAQWKKKYPQRQVGLANTPEPLSFAKSEPDWSEDDWEDSESPSRDDDAGAAEIDPGDNPYPEDFLKDPGYPMIGDDPEPGTWDELEKEISQSAWEPGNELDQFRGRDTDRDWDEALGGAELPPPRKADPISKVAMTLDDIKKDPDFTDMSTGSLHGMIAKAARKLGYTAQELSSLELDNLLDNTTDKYIDFLIKQGARRDENGKPMLSMSDVMELRGASKFEVDDEGRRVRKALDAEGEAVRRAIQDLPMFREYLSAVIEEMMEEEGFAVSHVDAAKDKDKHSVIHRMKSTTR